MCRTGAIGGSDAETQTRDFTERQSPGSTQTEGVGYSRILVGQSVPVSQRSEEVRVIAQSVARRIS